VLTRPGKFRCWLW